MSIATAITAAQGKVANAYTAVSNKGGTLPATQNLSNLPTAISSIPSGGGGGIPREVVNGVYKTPTTSFTFSLPSNATDIDSYSLSYAFYGSTALTSVDMSSLTEISGEYVFYSCFNKCRNLSSISLSSLTTISGEYAFYNAFRECGSLTSISFPSLIILSGSNVFSNAFYNCANLSSVNFPALSTISSFAFNNAFNWCTSLTDVYFNALKTTSFSSSINPFSGMLNNTGTTKTHKLHFPSNLQSTISGLSGYPLFGGTSGYVVCAFDLPATS